LRLPWRVWKKSARQCGRHAKTPAVETESNPVLNNPEARCPGARGYRQDMGSVETWA